jgi:ABC-type enterobactin transport system permease subunit
MTRIVRLIALPIVSAGMIGGAALGLAGMANATADQTPTGSGNFYSPTTFATPAPNMQPGWHNHHGPQHVADLNG